MNSVRGMVDLKGEEAKNFDEIVKTATKFAHASNFQTLHMPILEFASIFERLGVDSDIVGKEIYKFQDRGDKILALRPEFTAGIMRHAVQSNLNKGVLPAKFFSHGALFRYDRPQRKTKTI